MVDFPPRPAVNGKDFTSVQHTHTYPEIDPATKSDCTGRAVLITGASRGVGKATAISFAAAGAAAIAITARSDLSEVVTAIKERAKKEGKKEPQVLPLKVDVLDLKNVQDAVAKVKETFGRLDILYNNAGYLSAFETVIDSDPIEWWQTWETNVRGVYHVTKAFLPLLLETKDGLKIVVNASSIGAFHLRPGASSYQSSKTAVMRFTEFIQVEYGKQGILAINIHPGAVMTELARNMPPEMHAILTDTPEVSGDSFVYLTHKRREWLAGRYVSLVWDMPELMSREKEIVEGDKLKSKLIV
jgi:NAD(P)-dependent dehydrogenase (short-subunit alcohol dehydrogenase family)